MTKDTSINKADLLATLPPEWPADLLPEIRQALATSQLKIVVLDDDPTGTQTVYDIPVLTEWSVGSLHSELVTDRPAFYILTNSRSMPLAQAQALNGEIGRNLVVAARQAGCEFAVVSRSDSTLRGHFPGEVEAVEAALGQPADAWLIIPYFLEGGRYTINDIHYVAEGERLIPAAETPFARDAAFGYKSSNLRQWVAEKTAGRVAAEAVASISIEDLRGGGPGRVAERLLGLPSASVCVVNAVTLRDMEVFVRGLLYAEGQGRKFLYRTAASFVQVRAGLASRPLLTATDLKVGDSGGGLVVVGSYVPKTTSQVQALLDQPGLVQAVEVQVPALLDDRRQQVEIERVARQAEQQLGQEADVLIYTSRDLVGGADAEASLAIGRRVSESLVAIVQAISSRPRYLLAKGGITSSDVATAGLGIKKALVLGQILPGVPVWQAGPESRHPGLAYIVFPGNVGGTEALVEVVAKLK
jgi:uncharacterized protein YgbK (DUF1537 family)